MVKGFYAEMQNVASEVLREFDQSRGTGQRDDGIWYIAVTPGNGPADNPGPPVETPHKVDGAARGVQTKYVDGSTILAGDLQCVMSVRAGVTPVATGFVEVNGVRYKIREARQIPAAGVPVAYRLIFGK